MSGAIDLKRMRYVVAVARAEGLTAAAQVLGISQPALTRNIAEVEAELGVPLFHRLPRGTALTEHGERFVAQAQRILNEVADLVTDMTDEPGTLSGRLRIGLISDGYVSHAHDAIERIVTNHPEIGLEFSSGSTTEICPRLLHGDLHLVLGSSSYLQRWRGLQVTRLCPLRFTVMVRRDHPLAAGKDVEERALLGFPMVIIQGIDPLRADIAQRYHHYGLEMAPRYIAYDWAMVTRLVLSTDAFFPLYFRPVAAGPPDARFRFLPGVVDMPAHHISLAWAEHGVKTPLAALFETVLRETLAEPD